MLERLERVERVERVDGYKVRHPDGTIMGGSGVTSSNPAMSKKIAEELIRREANRLRLDPNDFTLVSLSRAAFVKSTNGKVVEN